MMNAGLSAEGTRLHPYNGSAATSREKAPKASNGHHDQMSVIGADILITGNIEANVDLHIEGRVLGDVRCSTLVLGEQSNVVGSIFAQRVRISGTVEGAIETKDLAIEGTANVKGDMTYSRLRVANGAVIQGNMIHQPLSEEEMAEIRLMMTPEPQAPATEAPAKVHYIE